MSAHTLARFSPRPALVKLKASCLLLTLLSGLDLLLVCLGFSHAALGGLGLLLVLCPSSFAVLDRLGLRGVALRRVRGGAGGE